MHRSIFPQWCGKSTWRNVAVIDSKQDKVVQGVVMGVLRGVGKPVVAPGLLGTVVGRPGIDVGEPGNPGIVVGRIGTAGRLGGIVGIVGRTATGSVGRMGVGRWKLGNSGRPGSAGNTIGPLGVISPPIDSPVSKLGITPLDVPVGRLTIAVDGTMGPISNKLASTFVAVGIPTLKDFGWTCKVTFARIYKGLIC